MSASGQEINESSPLKRTDNEPQTIEEYGSTFSQIDACKYRHLSNWDIFIFTLIFWIVYLSRKMLYPFAASFAEFYEMPLTKFSFILSSFEIGGACSILLTLLPSLHNIRIHLLIFLMVFTVGILYFILSFCYIFSGLFISRLLMGFVCTTLVAEMRGIMSIFTKQGNKDRNDNDDDDQKESSKLTLRILLTESAWFTSSVGWIIVGILIHQLNVNYVWYFGAICAVSISLSCYFLPRFNIKHVLAMKSKNNLNHENIEQIQSQSLIIQYHLYPMFAASLIFGIGYSMFLSTFGPWMRLKFNLNAQNLGFQTLFISFAELIALLTTGMASKYFTNISLTIISSLITALCSLIFFIGLTWFNYIVNEIFVLILLFVMTYFIEYTYLNMVVANLAMTPHGLESKSSQLLQSLGRCASIIGVVIGPHILQSDGFTLVIQYIFIAQSVAFILFFISHKLFNRKNINKS